MRICSIEKCIIEHCSPTLAGLKPAGLFSCCGLFEEDMLRQVKELNMKLNPKDIVVSVMTRKDGRALIYVYRKSRLKKELQNKETSEFLAKYGYSHLSVERLSQGLRTGLLKVRASPMK